MNKNINCTNCETFHFLNKLKKQLKNICVSNIKPADSTNIYNVLNSINTLSKTTTNKNIIEFKFSQLMDHKKFISCDFSCLAVKGGDKNGKWRY